MRSLFLRSSFLRLQIILALGLCCGLMLLDKHSAQFHLRRQQLAIVVAPIEWLSDLPGRSIEWVYQTTVGNQLVLQQNAQLQAQDLLLRAKLQQLLQLTQENHQLRALLNSSLQFKIKQRLVGHVLAIDPVAPRRQLIIDKGARQHVFVGQPVLGAQGVVGQVIDVTPLTSRVMLLADPESAIPVENTRTHQQAIAVGRLHQDQLQLLFTTQEHDLQVGDQWVASGLGLRFPAGYPVGRAVQVSSMQSSQHVVVWIETATNIDSEHQVLLIWPQSPKIVKLARKQLRISPALY